ncbi:Apoptosis-inducing factor 1, mitochondrial [Nymphon striatum]|nr:Apoptosis-inducing factor 1, mitochondrial [Nymphon striatum]
MIKDSLKSTPLILIGDNELASHSKEINTDIIFFEHEEYYIEPKQLLASETGGVAVLKNKTVVRIDPHARRVYLNDGSEITYEKCLLAPGIFFLVFSFSGVSPVMLQTWFGGLWSEPKGREAMPFMPPTKLLICPAIQRGKPKNLPIFVNADEDVQKKVTLYRGIIFFSQVKDFQDLSSVSRTAKSLTIIGGGFLGSELACALGHQGKKSSMEVNQIIPEKGNMAKVLPVYLSDWATKKIQNEGVNVLTSCSVQSTEKTEDNRLLLTLDNGEKITTDHVVIAVGLEPATDLAETSGLETDDKHGGFRVNAELEARSNLWVAHAPVHFSFPALQEQRPEEEPVLQPQRMMSLHATGMGGKDINLGRSFSSVSSQPNVVADGRCGC